MGKVSRRLQYYLYMYKSNAKGGTGADDHPGTYTHRCSDTVINFSFLVPLPLLLIP